METRHPAIKSPNYGGRFGYAFFRYLLRYAGVMPAYAFLALVVPYYLTCRGRARKSAEWYLRKRFPNHGFLRRIATTYQYFFNFGQVLIDQGAMGILGPDRFEIDFPEHQDFYHMANSGKGLIILTSHIGNWQTAMATMDHIECPVHFHFRLENHTEGRHFFDLANQRDRYHIISPDSEFGGLIEMTNALNNGECVAIMGDRAFSSRVVYRRFLGENAPFPVTPYHLAAATNSNIAALISSRTGPLKFKLNSFWLNDGMDMPSLDKRDACTQLLDNYIKVLEDYLNDHPFMWFNYYNFWNPDNA